jgi:hypothetical protein
MTDVSEEQNATFAFIPIPMELLEAFRAFSRREGGESGDRDGGSSG